ncbi:hypothetical protein HKD37_20G056455 [Glycine soja]|nr:hypothetical protein GmHk_20G057809 [Glycine max]
MASLVTHFCLFSSSFLYLHNPSHFHSKLWYFSDPKWKTLDLYALLIAHPIFSFAKFSLFFSFSGHYPTYKFSFFHQPMTLLAFWVLTFSIIVREHVGGTSVSSLVGSVYGFLGGLTLVCAGACIYLAVKPLAFFAEFLLSCGLVFKGTWLLQVGFSLYTDVFGLKGCGKITFLGKESVDVQCDLNEDILRGVALMHFLFIVHAIGVMVLAIGVFGVLAGNKSLRCGEARGLCWLRWNLLAHGCWHLRIWRWGENVNVVSRITEKAVCVVNHWFFYLPRLWF